jgi:polysaccharide chain length determinant protein (PEP-CTERM system associated)
MEERPFDPLDYVSVVRRRKWWLIVPIAVSIVLGILLAVFWPKTYISEAEIGVAAPRLSPELLKGVSSLDAQERQRAISQQLVSRTVLERVVRDERITPDKPIEQSAAKLRSNVVITVDKPIGQNPDNRGGVDSFKLGVQDDSPDRAQAIANRLAYVFVEENSKNQTERAENTSEVLGQQLTASQERLTQLESQLRTKKEANMGRLPDQISANVAMVNGLRSQLESISMQLRGEQDRLSVLETRLDEMRRGASASAMPASTIGQVQALQTRIAQLQQQITAEKALGKTDKHPDVVSLQADIASARAELNTVTKQSAAANRDDLLQADPIFRQALNERDTAKARIRTLQAAETQARAQIASYQSRVDAAPMVEQDLASITRDVELERERYKTLKTNFDAARSAEDLARKQGGERFSVLYPAYPGQPASPGQPIKLFVMALALGCVLGGGLAIGREYLDRSVHDVRALQDEFAVPVLGEIPRIHGAS